VAREPSEIVREMETVAAFGTDAMTRTALWKGAAALRRVLDKNRALAALNRKLVAAKTGESAAYQKGYENAERELNLALQQTSHALKQACTNLAVARPDASREDFAVGDHARLWEDALRAGWAGTGGYDPARRASTEADLLGKSDGYRGAGEEAWWDPARRASTVENEREEQDGT